MLSKKSILADFQIIVHSFCQGDGGGENYITSKSIQQHFVKKFLTIRGGGGGEGVKVVK